MSLDHLTETDLNRLAQVFYESTEPRISVLMTEKPALVEGLRGVFATLEVPITDDEPVTEVQLIPEFKVQRKPEES